MRKIILFLLSVALLAGCSSSYEKKAKWTRVAEKAKQTENGLPLGFSFGMSEEQVMAALDNLLKEGKISKEGENYCYNYPVGSNSEKCDLQFEFYQNKLYKFLFFFRISSFSDRGPERMQNLYESLSDKYKSGYQAVYEKLHKPSFLSYWFKMNQIITLGAAASYYLSYADAPMAKIVVESKSEAENERFKKLRDEAMDREQKQEGKPKVINSSWDSSVVQVENFLKKNLKDARSYEGIEWSKVNNTKDGYWVRHKYRAKNSFGGYVVSNQIFYINFDGEVTKVVDHK